RARHHRTRHRGTRHPRNRHPGTRHPGTRYPGTRYRGPRGRGPGRGHAERRAGRGERKPDRVPAPVGTHTYLQALTGEMIAMTQDQYGQARGSGYVIRGDTVPEDETEAARTDESRPMTRFQKVASALRGGSERDEPDLDADDPAAAERASADRTAAETH